MSNTKDKFIKIIEDNSLKSLKESLVSILELDEQGVADFEDVIKTNKLAEKVFNQAYANMIDHETLEQLMEATIRYDEVVKTIYIDNNISGDVIELKLSECLSTFLEDYNKDILKVVNDSAKRKVYVFEG